MASDPKNTEEAPTDTIPHKTSSSDLFSSAKVLAGAAKSSFSHDGAAFDKPKVAEAGEEIIDAASEYGKLKEKGYGTYVDKAEGYLHQLHSSDQKLPPHGKSTPEGKSTVPHEESAPEERKSTVPDEEERKAAGGFGGFGDYVNKAEGFFKK